MHGSIDIIQSGDDYSYISIKINDSAYKLMH